MSGVPVSPELRERAHKGLTYVYRKNGKDTTFIEIFELERAYILSGNDADKYVKVINQRLFEIDTKTRFYVLSDAQEGYLDELREKYGYVHLNWCKLVFRLFDKKDVAGYIKKVVCVQRILFKIRHDATTAVIEKLESVILNLIDVAKTRVLKHKTDYFNRLYVIFSQDLVLLTLGRDTDLQHKRMAIDFQPDDVEIGPYNFTMPYCAIPEFLRQFEDYALKADFLLLCEALAVASHNSQYTRKEALEYAEQSAKRFKIDK